MRRLRLVWPVAELPRFRVVFEEEAAEFLAALTRRKSRRLLDIARTLADHPFGSPDYVLPDADGRDIFHVLTEGYVISYWVDAPVKRVVIVEIEPVEI